MKSSCTKVKSHIRKDAPVKEYVRCNLIKKQMISIEEIISKADKKFNDLNIDAYYSGQSESNGQSVYYNVKLKTDDDSAYKKLRISDHSVTNINRLMDEIHLDIDVDSWSEFSIGRIMGKLNHPDWEYKQGPVIMPSGKEIKGYAYFKKTR